MSLVGALCVLSDFPHHFIRSPSRYLEAGPMVIIVTALVAIFTIGLGDNADPNSVSAYSVFNRGFQRLLGEVDAEELMEQHVGGGMAMAMAMERRRNEIDVDTDFVPQRRQQQPQQNEENAGQQQQNDGNNQSRKSGKKARRRNLEQRQELQRQRQAALDMGFGGDEGNQHEMLAMQRLIEEQIAANDD